MWEQESFKFPPNDTINEAARTRGGREYQARAAAYNLTFLFNNRFSSASHFYQRLWSSANGAI